MGRRALALPGQPGAACQAAGDLAEAAIEAFRRHLGAAIVTGFPGLGELAGARVLAGTGDDRARFSNARALRCYAGAAPVTRALGKSEFVFHRRVKDHRLAAAGHVWIFCALAKCPGARARYDRRRDAGDGHAAAWRNVFNRLLGCLFRCLQTGQHYDGHAAFASSSPAAA